jgi:integrase
LKTAKATRSVLLMPALALVLREHRLRSRHSQPGDYLFTATAPGRYTPTPSAPAASTPPSRKPGLDQPDRPRFRFHDLRHTYASLLIAQGVNVAFVSRQLGHASITTTLNVYTHLFDHAEHAASVIERLEDSFGDLLATRADQPAQAS